MSVDTRTPRTPTGDRSSGFESGFDDAPALSMVKVPSDPAQVIVNHASFRVQLGASTRASPRIARHLSVGADTARIPAAGAAGRSGAPAAGRRRAPVVWSGRSAPDDTGAHRLLQAVRGAGVGRGAPDPLGDTGSTQVIPRVDGPRGGYAGGGGRYGDEDGRYGADLTVETVETPIVGSQRTHGDHTDGTRLLPAMRTVDSAYDEPEYGQDAYADGEFADSYDDGDERGGRRTGNEPVRHAYYPGRRMNLGVVLLPLRVFLGFISVYAGMGKLCDPHYFDGGKRGSMVKWLNTLHPWEVAEPLRQFALEHPVGSGLVIAFAQVIVGVLTVFGLWQRVAAGVGALLSAALLVTVSWKTVPVYETPDIIYLAAWSPLIIAGAPVYSVDGRLAGGAWRTLGPRADIWELRRYVLRRGALVAAIVVGLTLLVGSLFGGAVRDADRIVVPGPGEAPRNELPGSPLPGEPSARREKSPSASNSPSAGATSATPSEAATTPGAAQPSTGAVTGGQPSQTQGTAGQAPPQQTAPAQQAPSTTAGPSASGGASSGATGGATGSTGGSGGGSSSGGQPGLVGGLLG
ncbi:DoxX family membrane protein [Streptomyces scabiei]|uniref:DoxX family protein n=2 Tax=Streptomyces scabiei TaxID=1930 RepID=UPI001562FD21|nr:MULTISPECIES: DoxX family protein [Streptomyces]MDX2537591.1 DoxX family membrane protein [Streptomyces scabiei]MDX2577215.1 DoxX family membrane protein [Streptomyces scabiei]MDX2655929.1 DoxX family membrane protein [Streptomyces scabiei]MDX2686884.1 DoxX family membrane protein [Streptomyces scabiei]MDX2721664.1 DoxX family membrane protein [Streptomyces scabiei]